MEGQIAINTLLRRMPNLRLKDSPDSLTWRPGLVLRGLKGLPETFRTVSEGLFPETQLTREGLSDVAPLRAQSA